MQQTSSPKAFVTGWPIAHSRSPALHGFWLRQLNIEGSYEAVAVPPEGLAKFLGRFPGEGFAGGNITIPHKQMAFELAGRSDARGEMLGALNTLWVEDGVVCGTNTDAYGFSANLDEHAPEWVKQSTAIVLGAGGASRAVIYAILEAGYSNIHIINRTQSRARALADRFGSRCNAHGWEALGELIGEAGLLVNTTSLGMEGGEELAIPKLDTLPAGAIVTDIVYTPLETPLLAAAKKLGYQTVDGLGMLLHQAVPGFEKWFGTRPQVSEALRRHVLEAGNAAHKQKDRPS